MTAGSQYFSPDYATARERFRETARAASAALHVLPLEAGGPGGEPLTIDIAWLGDRHPRRVLLHTSGLHGVEAFAGSAVQIGLLARPPALPAGSALILVHVLNPFGMAWLRRTNENNVDLNRNFLKPGEPRSGAPELYRRLDALLNPPSPPGFDFFPLRAAWAALRHGIRPLRQAAAEGQYELPRGLFYGGRQLEQGPRLYLDWLARQLTAARYLFALDVHTGLGDWGEEMLIAEPVNGGTPAAELGAALNRKLIDPAHDGISPYTIRGGMSGILASTLAGTRIDFLLQELGTYPAWRVFHALREENRWHHFGSGSPNHDSKRRLREALCPASAAWRDRATDLGLRLARDAATWIFNG